jgi:AcrR family transcriptional regulator
MKKPPKTYHHGELRKSLIEAGLDILSEKGAEAMSLRAVARKAGVSQTAPYRHFADKDELLAAISEEGFMELSNRLSETITQYDTPDEQLIQTGVTYVQFAMDKPEHHKVMFGGMVNMENEHASLRKVSDEAFGKLAALVTAGQSQKSFREENPAMSTLATWSLVHGLSVLLLNKHIDLSQFGTDDAKPLAEFCTRMLKNGWKPRN